MQGDGERGRRGVGVDVEDLPGGPSVGVHLGGDAGHHGHPARVQQVGDGAGVDADHVADQADVDLVGGPVLGRHGGRAPPCGQQAGVLAGHPDGVGPVGVDEADQLAPDGPRQDHPDDVHRLGGGDAVAAAELAGDAHPVEHRADLGPSAVHHHRPQPGQAQEQDVGGEGGLELVVDHGVAAVLDHDERTLQLLQPRQGLHQDGGLGPGGLELLGPARGRAGRRYGGQVAGPWAAHVVYAEFSCT